MGSIAGSSRQGGMTYLGMLFLLVVIAFVALVLIKVLPLYMEHFKVDSSLESLAQDTKGDDTALNPYEIEKRLMSRLSINDVKHVTKDDIKVTREGRKTVVSVDYEARVTLFGNLDLIARFPDGRVELGGP